MKSFTEDLGGYCVAYNKPFSEGLARVYTSSMEGYNEKVCIDALKSTAIELGRLPTPAEIIRKIDPNRFTTVTDKQEGTAIAQKIINAVRAFGGNAKPEKLREVLGEVGYEIVKDQWCHMCNTMQAADERIWFAQFRDLAEAMTVKKKAEGGSLCLSRNVSVVNLIDDLSSKKGLV